MHPEGFIVEGTKGPLIEGELKWANRILASKDLTNSGFTTD